MNDKCKLVLYMVVMVNWLVVSFNSEDQSSNLAWVYFIFVEKNEN